MNRAGRSQGSGGLVLGAPGRGATETQWAGPVREPAPSGVDLSVVVPARDEEATLEITLPQIVTAARSTGLSVEVLVVVPEWSPLVGATAPSPLVRYLVTRRPGKFEALRVGVQVAAGDVLVLADADVEPAADAFAHLVRPIRSGAADATASRAVITPHQDGLESCRARTLRRWAGYWADVWHELRTCSPASAWALPGSLYAVRADMFPHEIAVGLVDDASIGLALRSAGARIVYEPRAVAGVRPPTDVGQWARQKLRSRQGWAALRAVHERPVVEVEQILRGLWRERLHGTLDRPLILAADAVLRVSGSLTRRQARHGTWQTVRRSEWDIFPGRKEPPA